MLAVVDTNVLVSGLLTLHTIPARVVDMIYTGRIHCLHDDRILDEYRRVLSRPKFAQAISSREVNDLLSYLVHSGRTILSEPLRGLPGNVPDPDDLPFAEVAVTGNAACLITGNTIHFHFLTMPPWSIAVFSPREAYDMLCKEV
ncbi:putative toxin-antitoxin system toxin component, PIN family [Desulfonatronum thiosulfatophilum]|uniref:Putative toxin-antitoxin system toxin component, PIN family n=1 Tax=Desulfonatronum thiosulfatophilum TaxID=617002 RepID=A0A1G6DYY5_9BACT|nr:putative toxin-antitoxin system toxin component, PIN family [Desulfonatronum thiosulfatophilum]SDB50332.1 putative toxin-antitoxin system toxin component, PIN family [Desulfonatronum thiosulfatophilum]